MSTFIKPTIGRKVWYRPNEFDRAGPGGIMDYCYEESSQKKQPCDATVIGVSSDRYVNLMVIDHSGRFHPRTSVYLRQPGEDLPQPGIAYAEWMPYQAGQAKKEQA